MWDSYKFCILCMFVFTHAILNWGCIFNDWHNL